MQSALDMLLISDLYDRMFSAGVPCETVHSQGRRMVMFSPEPNFWMHAVSIVPRAILPHYFVIVADTNT